MITPPTTEWSKLHQIWYRRYKIWDMHWPAEFPRNSFVAAAPFGGPIAVLANCRSGTAPTSTSADSLSLIIYTSAGNLLGKTAWTFGFHIINMKWVNYENLVFVFPSGTIRVFSPLGHLLYCFDIDIRIKPGFEIISAVISNEAIVVLTRSMQFYVNLGFRYSRCSRLADTPQITVPPNAMAIVSGPTGNDDFSVIVAPESGPLYLIDQLKCERLPTPEGPFYSLVTSPSGRLLAATSHQNILFVFSASDQFRQPVDAVPLPSNPELRKSMVWVGEDCLAVHHVITDSETSKKTSMLYVGGPGNQWIPHMFDTEHLILVPEIDSVRTVGDRESYAVQRVPNSTVATLGPGSSEFAASLVTAWRHFQAEHPSANVVLDATTQDLVKAILNCCDAASHEPDTEIIKLLLHAAVFGRSILNERTSDSSSPSHLEEQGRLSRLKRQCCKVYLTTCRDLRVCLALHNNPVNIPVSAYQYRSLGPSVLMEILAKRYQHLLALRIGDFLGLGKAQNVNIICDSLNDDYSLQQFFSSMHGGSSENVGLSLVKNVIDTTRPVGVILALSQHHPQNESPVLSKRITPWQPITTLGTVIPMQNVSTNPPTCFVLEHWATEKISCSPKESDSTLLQTICQTFSEYNHLRPSMINIALAAASLSRTGLAASLLQFEPRTRVQVRILLRINEYDKALQQAVGCGDPDLIYEALTALESAGVQTANEKSHNFVLDALHRFPLLWKFYEIQCYRAGKLKQLQRLYEADSQLELAGFTCMAQGLYETKPENVKQHLAHAAAAFGSSFKPQSRQKTLQKLTLEHVELLELQKDLESIAAKKKWHENALTLQGTPLSATLKELYMRSQHQEASRLEKLFDVPPKRALKLHLQALLKTNRLEEIVVLGQNTTNQTLLGGTDYLIKLLKRSTNTAVTDDLIRTLNKSSTSARSWMLPRVFSHNEGRATMFSHRGEEVRSSASSLLESLAHLAFSRSTS